VFSHFKYLNVEGRGGIEIRGLLLQLNVRKVEGKVAGKLTRLILSQVNVINPGGKAGKVVIGL